MAVKRKKSVSRNDSASTRIIVSNESKVLFSKSGITKGEVFAYYESIAPFILPYLKQRPLTLVRCPSGVPESCFFQKDTKEYVPSFVGRYTVTTQEGTLTHYALADKKSALMYLVNQATISFHTWSTRIDKPLMPDMMIFDLDPVSREQFKSVVGAAQELKVILESYGMKAWVKLTGSKGLHVVVPLKRTVLIDDVRATALHIANELVTEFPRMLTTDIRKSQRGKKIFIDTIRNSYSHTTVAPYSIRTTDKASVALPVEWEELHDSRLRSDTYTITTALKRVSERGDIWQQMSKQAISLKKISCYEEVR